MLFLILFLIFKCLYRKESNIENRNKEKGVVFLWLLMKIWKEKKSFQNLIFSHLS